MRILQPFLLFFSGAIFVLFLYQFFDNSILYSSNKNTDIEYTKKKTTTNKPLSNKVLKEITIDLISIKGDVNSLRYELQNIKKEEKISNIDDAILIKFESLKEEIKTLHKRIDKGIKNNGSNQLSSFLPSASQEKASDDKATSPELDFDAKINAAETARKQSIIKLDDQFHSEATDEQWSIDTKQKITVFFENNETVQSSISSMACHSTMCQIEVKHENKEAEEKFNLEFPFSLGDSFSSTTYGNQTEYGDGSSSVVMYLGNQ